MQEGAATPPLQSSNSHRWKNKPASVTRATTLTNATTYIINLSDFYSGMFTLRISLEISIRDGGGWVEGGSASPRTGG